MGLLGSVFACFLLSVSDFLITEHILTLPGSVLRSAGQNRRSPEGSGGMPGGLGG